MRIEEEREDRQTESGEEEVCWGGRKGGSGTVWLYEKVSVGGSRVVWAGSVYM